jgi:glycerophosphoryl diester phosphodiesterase
VRRRPPLVIAHRGASGYLPEHTLAAKALAHGLGADFLEQDVVLTRDGVPIVLHDIFLDSTTDVAARFPGRARSDGHFHAVDFSLAEVRELRVHERRTAAGDAVYPGRFPTDLDLFGVPTLDDEIALITGLDRARGTRTGLYVELKSPNRHRAAGLDLSAAVLAALERHGYADKREQVFLQCFDDQTLKTLRERTPLPLVQLIADNTWGEDSEADYEHLRSDAGLDHIATYADAIGPWLCHIYLGRDAAGQPVLDDLVARARARGLAVHPYTFRSDDLPAGMNSFAELLDLFINGLRVDGLFTDFPDKVAAFIDAHA